MGSAYHKFRVTYIERPHAMETWEKTEHDALEFAVEALERDGVEWTEMWAVELPTEEGR